jgi:hypothetical protein
VGYKWLHINGGPLGFAIGMFFGVAVWALYETVIRLFRSMRGTNRQTADVFG